MGSKQVQLANDIIGEIIQNLLIKYMVCDIVKMDIYNWHIYAFSAVLCC